MGAVQLQPKNFADAPALPARPCTLHPCLLTLPLLTPPPLLLPGYFRRHTIHPPTAPRRTPSSHLQVEQGLGIGTGFPLFNRAEASLTRFLQLLPGKGRRAPAVLVAHAKGGAALGDLPAYDAFLLGGPHSGARFCVPACMPRSPLPSAMHTCTWLAGRWVPRAWAPALLPPAVPPRCA